MSPSRPGHDEDRLFVRKGRRFYRRQFSRNEARWGVAILVGLAAIGGWVAWKGAHPDPALFAAGVDAGPGGSPAGRDPFPTGLAAAGWREGAVAHFDSTNLYVKIDGREDYYKSFGFRRLHWVSLAIEGDAATVDVELFDLGTAANALGAYAGERSPDARPELTTAGLWHRSRNADFASIGRYYARILGSDESDAVLAQLEHVRRQLSATLPAEPLPWGYALFVGQLGLEPGRVAYVPENAFSFGFARHVYSAPLGDDDLEGFVTAAADEAGAADLAARFRQGFLEYGEDHGRQASVRWVRDRYLGTLSAAVASDGWVVGVRSAPDAERGAAAIERLVRAVRALPDDVVARARAEARAAATPAATTGEAGEPAPGAGESEY